MSLQYGYYADVTSGCRIFHVCLPIADDVGNQIETHHYSFLCGNQTVFDQHALVCNHAEDAFPCNEVRRVSDFAISSYSTVIYLVD